MAQLGQYGDSIKGMSTRGTVLETEAGFYAREVGGVDGRPILESRRMVSRTFKV